MKMITAKTIVTHTANESWFGTKYNMNIYRGCSHGCIYCDSRSACYDISDFHMVRAKENSTQIIENELRSKRTHGVISTGSMSDPYNPMEAHYHLTQDALRIIDRYHFGVSIATKSDLIIRDIDILKSIAKHSPVLCKITLTTIDDDLARKIEPNAPLPSARLHTLKELSDAGIFCGVLLMPVLPFIEDDPQAITALVNAVAASGARFIYPAFGMTLRDNQREYYLRAISRLFPEKKLATCYAKQYGNTYQCYCPNAKDLWLLFKGQCADRNLLYNMKDIINAYQGPYATQQLSFFDL